MFYIYHIPGIKIGCTTQYPQRCLDQGYEDYELLEQYEDGWHAGDRELILQAEYGYPIDKSHYMISRQNRAKGLPIGYKHTDDAKRKMSNARKGKPLSEEHRLKKSIAQIGRTVTNETRNKLSAARKGVPMAKHQCPHCGKYANAGNINRWHNDNCKKS